MSKDDAGGLPSKGQSPRPRWRSNLEVGAAKNGNLGGGPDKLGATSPTVGTVAAAVTRSPGQTSAGNRSAGAGTKPAKPPDKEAGNSWAWDWEALNVLVTESEAEDEEIPPQGQPRRRRSSSPRLQWPAAGLARIPRWEIQTLTRI